MYITWRYLYAKHFVTMMWLLRVDFDPEVLKAWTKFASDFSPLCTAHMDVQMYMGAYCD